MQPESRKLLSDMREAADAIIAFSHGKKLSDLTQDKLPILRAELEQLLAE